jgi:transcriptional regulator with XRE-family HTH domain
MKNDARQRARQRLDERLAGLKPTDRYQVPPKGWIRAIRDAPGMTGAELASRLGVRPQSVDALEKSEASGTIQLASLRRALSRVAHRMKLEAQQTGDAGLEARIDAYIREAVRARDLWEEL